MKRIALIFFAAVLLALAGWAYHRAPARLRPAEAELKSQREIIEHYTRIYDVRDLILQRIAKSARPESAPTDDADPPTETTAAIDLYASWQSEQSIMFAHYIAGQWVVQARLADHVRIERMLLDLRRKLNRSE